MLPLVRVFVSAGEASGDLYASRVVEALAEMIETEAEAEHYRRLGIDYGQGYLFGYPEIGYVDSGG